MIDAERGLLAAVCADPADDTARLVYADWLDEHGEPGRAEFIRVQISFARAPESYAYNTALREHQLLCLRAYDWVYPLMRGRSHKVEGTTVRMPHDGELEYEVSFSRGFIAALTCTATDWLAHADALYWRPEQTVTCTACGGGGWTELSASSGDWKCGICERGRIARPCPGTAQPLTTVVLTGCDDWDRVFTLHEFSVLHRHGLSVWSSAEWPGITFEVPPI